MLTRFSREGRRKKRSRRAQSARRSMDSLSLACSLSFLPFAIDPLFFFSPPSHLLVRPGQALAHHLAFECRPQRRRGPRPHGVSRQAGLALLVDEQDELDHRSFPEDMEVAKTRSSIDGQSHNIEKEKKRLSSSSIPSSASSSPSSAPSSCPPSPCAPPPSAPSPRDRR